MVAEGWVAARDLAAEDGDPFGEGEAHPEEAGEKGEACGGEGRDGAEVLGAGEDFFVFVDAAINAFFDRLLERER